MSCLLCCTLTVHVWQRHTARCVSAMHCWWATQYVANRQPLMAASTTDIVLGTNVKTQSQLKRYILRKLSHLQGPCNMLLATDPTQPCAFMLQPHADADSALLISPSTLTRLPANCFDTAASTADLMVRVRDTMSDSCRQYNTEAQQDSTGRRHTYQHVCQDQLEFPATSINMCHTVCVCCVPARIELHALSILQ